MDSPPTAVYYRFTDETGRLHLVDSLSKVPPEDRASAERIELTPPNTQGFAIEDAAGHRSAIAWPSFGLGFASAVALALVLLLLRSHFGTATKIVLTASLVALLGLGYLGVIRRQIDPHAPFLASPSSFVEDAKQNVDKLKERQAEQ